MSHELLIRFCAPTLAGIKVSNLVNIKYECKKVLLEEIANKNKLLNPKGVFIEIMKITETQALIYVYRKNDLHKILQSEEVREFLKNYNYFDFSIENTIFVLKKHIQCTDFPHEIGIFLGYPISDVIAFIENKGKNEKYVGCWKAYSNKQFAEQMFIKYKKCTRIYCEKFELGIDICKLTVAC